MSTSVSFFLLILKYMLIFLFRFLLNSWYWLAMWLYCIRTTEHLNKPNSFVDTTSDSNSGWINKERSFESKGCSEIFILLQRNNRGHQWLWLHPSMMDFDKHSCHELSCFISSGMWRHLSPFYVLHSSTINELYVFLSTNCSLNEELNNAESVSALFNLIMRNVFNSVLPLSEYSVCNIVRM